MGRFRGSVDQGIRGDVVTTIRLQLRAGRLSADEWSPFGWLPVRDTDPADAGFHYEFAWGDAHVNIITHTPDEVDRRDDALVCDRFYRHDTHTQVLLPLNVDSVVAVAPASVKFSSADDLESVRAFALRPLEGFALGRGTWHWGPFPVGATPVDFWNVQGKRYAEDNVCAEIETQLGAVITIDVTP